MKFFDGIDDLETEKVEIYDLPPLPARDTLMLFICDEIKKKATPPPSSEDGQWI
jgi:hypothetical protein